MQMSRFNQTNNKRCSGINIKNEIKHSNGSRSSPMWPYLKIHNSTFFFFSSESPPHGRPLSPEKSPPSPLQILPFFLFPSVLSLSQQAMPVPVPSAAQKLCPLCSLRAPKHSPPIMSSPGKIKLKIQKKSLFRGSTTTYKSYFLTFKNKGNKLEIFHILKETFVIQNIRKQF